MVDKALKELIHISNVTGIDQTLVQGGGGNTSVKTADGKYMFIKASGSALKDMNTTLGWRRLSMDSVLSILKDGSLKGKDDAAREAAVVKNLLCACDDNTSSNARPSVESHLHAILDTYVIHLHPLAVGAYVNAKGGKATIEKLFEAEKLPPVWVPYTDPGYLLAMKLAKLVKAYKAEHHALPQVIFLEKHGLFVTADTAKKALAVVNKVIKLCNSKLPALKPLKAKAVDAQAVRQATLAIRQAMYETTGQYLSVNHSYDGDIAKFMNRKDAAKLLNAGSLVPDEIVYANGAPLWLDKSDAKTIAKKVQAILDKGRKAPASFVVKGLGLFVATDLKSMATTEVIARGSLYVRQCAASLGGVNTLTKREHDFISNWESESYRKQLVSAEGVGAVKDQIAAVTGAGSGIGRGLAIGLARAGAIVAVCDIDTNAADETVAMIKQELPNANAITVACNVTDEASVEAGFAQIVKAFGGFDILVNAAGVAPAYSLVDLPVDKWRFALEVNLTGYFLMAKHAARIMIAQGIGGSIVNISSKSGLEASMKNTPYNATKAGELHMTRGWAMELGEYGIRVNNVCPGNVFEGSKIWNPDYIKVCAKKYGIKPEEVIPHYVNKTILKREIKAQDIADSVVFLASDKARTMTGQTLVADSGQVMVR